METIHKKTFAKPPQSIPRLLAKLEARGLIIPDPDLASHHLKFIGFYRLSAYMLPFQHQGTGADRHQFRPGTTFDDVLGVHGFDRKLRLLVLDALERVEVAVRSAISDHIECPKSPVLRPGRHPSGSAGNDCQRLALGPETRIPVGTAPQDPGVHLGVSAGLACIPPLEDRESVTHGSEQLGLSPEE